jgi:hypothetical protein
MRTMGLFESWLVIERATGRPMAQILSELNEACGSRYRHNWPSTMRARGYGMDRCPTEVRRYMMQVVLQGELAALGAKATAGQVEQLVERLT